MSILCRQCGLPIKEGEGKRRDAWAHRRGFCSSQCEEVYDVLKQWDYAEARKGMVL